MTSNLPSTLHSPEQIEAVLFELDEYLARRRSQDTKKRLKTVSSSKAVSEINWTSELEAVLGTPAQAAKLSLTELESKVKELRSWRSLPVVNLTLPVRPPAQLREGLVAWFRHEISPLILVKFGVNSSLIGGIVVRTPQHIHDFSFRRLLQDKQSRIPEILKNAK